MRNSGYIRYTARTCSLIMSAMMALTVMVPAPVLAAARKDDKTETVYVNAKADGTADKITVSSWLANEDKKDSIDDFTTLSDIKNVKGDETYRENADGTITWEAKGKEIYYQGESHENLPVSVRVSYYLNGKKTDAEDLAGKSGKVRIRLDYSNHSFSKVKVKKKEYTIHTPFTVISAMILPSDHFSNVEVVNGRAVNDGDKNIVIGYAMPGLKESLALSSYKELEDVKIPEYVEVEADAKDFELSMTASVVTNGVLDDIDTKNLDDLDGLEEDMDKLTDASAQLVDGSKTLADGIGTLSDSFGKYAKGVGAADKGSRELAGGLKKLDKNSLSLVSGTGSLKKGLKSLKKGTRDMKNGIKDYTQGSASLETGIRTANQGSTKLASGAKELKKGVASYTAGTEELADGISELNKETSKLKDARFPDTSVLSSVDQTFAAVAGDGEKINKQAEGLAQTAGQIAGLESDIDSLARTLTGDLGKLLQDAASMKENMKKSAEENGSAQARKAAEEAADQAVEKANQALADKVDDGNKKIDSLETSANSKLSDAGDRMSRARNKLDFDTSGMTDAQKKAVAEARSILEGGAGSVEADHIKKDSIDKIDVADVKVSVEVNGDLNADAAAVSSDMRALGGTMEGAKKELSDLSSGAGSLKDSFEDFRTDAQTLQKISASLSSAIKELSGLKDRIPQLVNGVNRLDQGAKKLTANNKTLNEGADQIARGAGTLSNGLAVIEKGSDKLNSNNRSLNEGSASLYKGAKKLYTGSGTLYSGIELFTDGVALSSKGGKQLADGMGKLTTATGKVDQGINVLRDGAGQLADGMDEFDSQGISKLADLAGDDLNNVVDHVRAVKKADSSYSSYSGKADKARGSVKFIIETDQVGGEE